MSYISKTVVLREARNKKTLVEKASQQSRHSTSSDSFDIFLCHSSIDTEIVEGIAAILEQAGLTVYIDWIVDYGSTDSGISKNNAVMLKNRMNRSANLVYVHTPYASSSKWCPWELGYFDKSSKPIYVALVSEGISTTGQEYLDQYEKLTLSTSLAPFKKYELRVNGTQKQAFK